MLPMLCLPSLGIMLRAFLDDDLVLREIGRGRIRMANLHLGCGSPDLHV